MSEEHQGISEELQGEALGRIEKRGDLYFWVRPDGEQLQMYGYGGGMKLDLDPRIDLTKPIFEQVKRLLTDDAEEERQQSGRAA